MTDVATLPHTEGRPPLELPIHRRTVEEDVAVQTPPNSLEQLAAEASLENLSLDDQMARLNISLEDEPEMLKVVLRPVLGCKIGMTVMRFAEGFIVTSIHDKGIVASWNAAHPGQSLEERDLIVQINGSGEYLQMLHHFRCAPVLLMLIHRQEISGLGHGNSRKELSSNPGPGRKARTTSFWCLGFGNGPSKAALVFRLQRSSRSAWFLLKCL
ncbi:unnamed protein product [Durusdinium trenchii]|uniref:PDZ domain-containing protein n=1 Tax=Durusdinium trenchii TaxID=1381693 RepID=A0ABP0SUD8_9DINO